MVFKINKLIAPLPTKSQITDKTFLFTGTLTEFTRNEAEAFVEANGGKVLSGVTAKLNYLVVGEDAGSKLEKAKQLGTVKILSEKEFLKLINKKKGIESSKSQVVKKSYEIPLSRNEILCSCKLNDVKKIIKKHGGNEFYDDFGTTIHLIKSVQDSISFDDITSDDKEVFYWSENESRLIIHRLIKSSFEQIDLTEDFFKDIAKFSKTDFKVSFLNRDTYKLVFCINRNGKVYYDESRVEDWEDPLYFEDVPYFVKLAKQRGMKKKKNEIGDREYDSEEVYDLIYELRDNLLSGDNTYLELAPDWYLEMKTIV